MENTRGRTSNTVRNIIWLILSQIVATVLGILCRKVFLANLNIELLGVNSLFTDILAVFSFAELGFGSALAFSLYRPIAEGNIEESKAYLLFSRKIYRIIITILIILSIAFFPFLGFLKTDLPLNDVRLYYLIFQVNNIIGYICVYRETYIIAAQQERLISKIGTVTMIISYGFQILFLYLFKNMYVYLLTGTFFVLMRKIFINIYIYKKYPEISLKNAREINQDEKKTLFRKVRSLFVHKVGNLAINQTDSLIVSYIISVAEWGFVSNYLSLKTAILSITSKVYGAVLPSFGNLVARADKEKQLKIFYIYDFVNNWIYTFCFIGLGILSTPFVSLFFGPENVIEHLTIFTLLLAFYIDGLRNPVSLLREASGNFEKDKWFTIVAAVLNLGVSIGLAFVLGVVGIYLGTIVAMVTLIISRTIILFKNDYQGQMAKYFVMLVLHLLLAVGIYALTYFLSTIILNAMGTNVLSFVLLCLLVLILPNAIFLAVSFFIERKNVIGFFDIGLRFYRRKLRKENE